VGVALAARRNVRREVAIARAESLVSAGLESLLRLGVATLIGAAVGINREMRRKPAGMRTHALVSLGAALAMLSILDLSSDGGHADPSAVSRSAQGIVVGIGFLGGGVIIKTGEHGRVRNLTTAASIWVVACLGMACGAGQWDLAIGAVVLTLLVLVTGGPIESALRRRFGLPTSKGARERGVEHRTPSRDRRRPGAARVPQTAPDAGARAPSKNRADE
jgi:putative Mg2+ transporter-C (MgtC) family protein